MKSNLAIRLLTAAVVVPPLLTLLFIGPAWGFFALVLVATAISASELFRMTHPDDGVARGIGIVTAVGAGAATYVYSSDPRALLTMVAAVTLIGLLTPLWRLGDMQSAALRTAAGVAGPFYVGTLLAFLAMLRRDGGVDGGKLVFMSLTFSWLADTGGYFFGRFLGKTKLYEAVSPKKTRAGFVGALVGAEASSTFVQRGCLPGDTDGRRLQELTAYAVEFGSTLATARLGAGRTDLFDRLALSEALPAFTDGFTGGVADPSTGRIGLQIVDPVRAADLALRGRLPFAVCAG